MKYLFFLLLFPAFAFAQSAPIPFRRIGNYLFIPVHIESETAILDIECVLDTAASDFWISIGLAEYLGITSKYPELSWPPYTIPYLRIGDIEYKNQFAHGWSKLGGVSCLLGMNLFWRDNTCFDFRSGLISSFNDDNWWFNNWNACKATLDYSEKNHMACGENLAAHQYELELWRTGHLVLKNGKVIRK